MMVGHRCSVFIFGHTRLEDFFKKKIIIISEKQKNIEMG